MSTPNGSEIAKRTEFGLEFRLVLLRRVAEQALEFVAVHAQRAAGAIPGKFAGVDPRADGLRGHRRDPGGVRDREVDAGRLADAGSAQRVAHGLDDELSERVAFEDEKLRL